MHGILKLRAMIQDDPSLGWRERYNAVGTEEIVPLAGPGEPASIQGHQNAVGVFPTGDTAGA
jgi:NADH-quinone oxidoreductase subunit B